MSGVSPKTTDPEPPADAAPPVAPSGSRRGAIVGAVLALAASAGLAWWLSAPDRTQATRPAAAPPPAAAPAKPVQLASAQADPAQVARAYEQVQTVYADQGVDGLVRFSENCGKALAHDPRVLDFCLAFDMFAEAVAPQEGDAGAWFAVGNLRRIQLAQAALPPGTPAEARIAEVGRLMRQASGAAEVEAVKAQPKPEIERTRRPDTAKAVVAKRKVRAAIARKAVAPKAQSAALDRCARLPSRAERLLCANPDLEAADARMRRAYRDALDSAADPSDLAAEQAAWRAARDSAASRDELASAYARRIEDLERQAAPPF